MADILTTMQGAIELVETLKQISAKVKDEEIRRMVADLVTELDLQLVGAKHHLAELLGENSRLKTELQLLKSHFSREEGLLVRNGLYFSASGDGPFCPHCHDAKRQVIRLTKQMSPWKEDYGEYACPACKECFNESVQQ